MCTKTQLAALLVTCVVVLTMWPVTAQAQRRPIRRGHYVRTPHPRPVVVVGGYYARPFFYDRYFAGPPWYAYPFGVHPPYGPYPAGYTELSAVRIQVMPRETEVYLDGYLAGTVDDFDGLFQRLVLPPGEQEIVLYLDGYRTVRQNLFLTPGSTYKMHHTMERLKPGEASEPRPVASAQPTPMAAPSPTSATAVQVSGFGTLWIRVQPADAEVLIDGERWRGPEAQEALVVQVSEGAHRIEIRKDGYRTFSTEVRVRREETTPLNVSLPPVERQ